MIYTPTFFSQQDPQWKDDKLGFSNSTIGTGGCTITAITMLLKGFGYDETPASLNEKLKDFGQDNGFIDALVVWGAIPYLFPKLKYKNLLRCPDDNAPLSQIDSSLANGQPVLVELDRLPTPGAQNHWVLLYAKEGDDYLMTDPWPYPPDNKKTLLSHRYTFGRSIAKTITAVVWYEMEGVIPPPPTDGFYLRVSSTALSGLRIRTEPNTASITLDLAPTGSYLRVMEDEDGAKAKIGVVNQWMKVRDLKGVEGFVAAWYVENISGTAPDPEVDTDPEPEPDPEPIPDPPDSDRFKCYVNPSVGDSGLRMRANPGLGGSLVTTLSASTELIVLEDEDAARAKIDVPGAWIHARDGAQHEGYVAAWLVLLSLDDTPSPEPDPEPEPQPEPDPEPIPESTLKCYVSPSVGDSGLKMRSQPSIGGNLVEVLNELTELNVLEDEERARAKIGVSGEWLYVQNGIQNKGYVAAWFVLLSLDDIPDPIPETEPTLKVTSVTVFPSLGESGLRMRAEPSLAGRLLTILKGGTKLVVLEAGAESKIGVVGDWLHVHTLNGIEGYVAAWYVKANEDEVLPEFEPSSENLTVYVMPLARYGLRMRKGPSSAYPILKTLMPNTALTVLGLADDVAHKIGANGEWLHVQDASGAKGYVAAWYVILGSV